MWALVKARDEAGLQLVDVPDPEAGPDDLLLRVLRTGICGTDVHIWTWDAWARRTVPVGLIVGHEFVGEVVGVGANVDGFARGDLVSGEGHLVCGSCRNCKAGRRHLCASTLGLGVQVNGAFAEFVALPAVNAWRHSPGIDLDVAAIFDPFGNAVHSALAFRVCGEDVLVTGAGPIGVMAAAVARHAGARHVVVTDPNPVRRGLAESVGATRVVDPRAQTLGEAQRELGMREGFDVGFEMSGNPGAFRDMLTNMAHGGKIAILGIPPEQAAIDWNVVIFNMLTLRGIYGREMFETWYSMSVLIESGLDISPVITHRLAIDDFHHAFEVAASGDAGKVVLAWDA